MGNLADKVGHRVKLQTASGPPAWKWCRGLPNVPVRPSRISPRREAASGVAISREGGACLGAGGWAGFAERFAASHRMVVN